MAAKPEDLKVPLEEFYTQTAEFPAGFMTQYPESMLIGAADHQALATGFPIGKRFKSSPVVRVADANPVQLGHHHRADGRWRLYAFAGAEHAALTAWAKWMRTAVDSPLRAHTPAGSDIDSIFDVKVVYQEAHTGVDLGQVDEAFLPRTGPFGLIDYEKVYAADPADDIFLQRGISRDGAIVVVRPDQYVAHVLPMDATDDLAAYFRQMLLTR
jgi:phenol 2-monooxygenase